MFKFLTTYLWILIGSQAFAQSADTFKISGSAMSSNSGHPISDGTIMFTKNKGVLTDDLGHFTIYGLTKGQHKLSFSALGYDNKDTIVTIFEAHVVDFKLRVFTNCNSFPEVNREIALRDINAGRPTLLLFSGISPIVYTTDKKFLKKYNLSFSDFGCTPGRRECLLAYNRTIFEYLDKKYGKNWRTEVRQDVVGLND